MIRRSRIISMLLAFVMVLSTVFAGYVPSVSAKTNYAPVEIAAVSFVEDDAMQVSRGANNNCFFVGQTVEIESVLDEATNVVDFDDVNIKWVIFEADNYTVVGEGKKITILPELAGKALAAMITSKDGTPYGYGICAGLSSTSTIYSVDERSLVSTVANVVTPVRNQDFISGEMDVKEFRVYKTASLAKIKTTLGEYNGKEILDAGFKVKWQKYNGQAWNDVEGANGLSYTFALSDWFEVYRVVVESDTHYGTSPETTRIGICSDGSLLYVDAEGSYSLGQHPDRGPLDTDEGYNGSTVYGPELTSARIVPNEFRAYNTVRISEIKAGDYELDLAAHPDAFNVVWQVWDEKNGWRDIAVNPDTYSTRFIYGFSKDDIGKYYRALIDVYYPVNSNQIIWGRIYVDAEGSVVASKSDDMDSPRLDENNPTISTIEGRNGSIVKGPRELIVSGKLDKENFYPGETVTITEIRTESKSIEVNDTNADYQWQKYNPESKRWDDIDAATGHTYTPSNNDEGSYIRVRIIGKGDYYGEVYVDASGSFSRDDNANDPVNRRVVSIPPEDPDNRDGLRGTPVEKKSEPTVAPTAAPTVAPTETPTATPTVAPTEDPNSGATATPDATASSSSVATSVPTVAPTGNPNGQSAKATSSPTKTPGKTYVPGKRISEDSIELYIPTITGKKNMGFNKKFQIKLLNTKGCKVYCQSSNKKIATINKKGLVKSKKKKGKAKLIINVEKGSLKVQYIINVYVKKRVPKNYSLIRFVTSYKGPSVSLYKRIPMGKSFKVTLKHIAKGAKLSFVSSNKKVATVNNKGKIKPKKVGKSIITITAVEEGVTYKYYVVARVTKNGVESKTDYLKVIK